MDSHHERLHGLRIPTATEGTKPAYIQLPTAPSRQPRPTHREETNPKVKSANTKRRVKVIELERTIQYAEQGNAVDVIPKSMVIKGAGAHPFVKPDKKLVGAVFEARRNSRVVQGLLTLEQEEEARATEADAQRLKQISTRHVDSEAFRAQGAQDLIDQAFSTLHDEYEKERFQRQMPDTSRHEVPDEPMSKREPHLNLGFVHKAVTEKRNERKKWMDAEVERLARMQDDMVKAHRREMADSMGSIRRDWRGYEQQDVRPKKSKHKRPSVLAASGRNYSRIEPP